MSTLRKGEGKLELGRGPVRTGVTAILPRGRDDARPCFAAWETLNAAGEMTGTVWLDERGLYEGPILITNTHEVGIVRDASIQWMRRSGIEFLFATPIVAETFDGLLNDIDGGHIKSEHVFEALDGARGGPIPEGNVGGGTGMITYEYKGGTGTASRQLSETDGGYIVGVLVQSNYGERRHLRLGGLKVGEQLLDDMPKFMDRRLLSPEFQGKYARWLGGDTQGTPKAGEGSIIVIVATDAPLLPHQLKRLAKRPALAIGRLGGVGSASSGDIFLAVSTANESVGEAGGENARSYTIDMHPNLAMTSLFEAVIDATEEAIVNAMVAADAMEGVNRLFVPALPIERVREILAGHNLLAETAKD
ncbi:L-aminopeptidase/D-esterase-like protein [Sphingosinicella microcystinivorans]|nr:L-aminopeptidase/D-esterase-like protein [Sphingosinicella microcystinivorans]